MQSAVYEQKDPLLIYKFEAFNLFKQMVADINREVASFLFKGNIPVQSSEEVKEARAPQKTDMSGMRAGRDDTSGLTGGQPNAQQGDTQTAQKVEPVRVARKVGRNEPCPCGSGKKYKHCHGK